MLDIYENKSIPLPSIHPQKRNCFPDPSKKSDGQESLELINENVPEPQKQKRNFSSIF